MKLTKKKLIEAENAIAPFLEEKGWPAEVVEHATALLVAIQDEATKIGVHLDSMEPSAV